MNWTQTVDLDIEMICDFFFSPKRYNYYSQVDLTYSTFLYDTIYLYALVVNHTIEQGENSYNGVTIFQNTKLQHFKGKKNPPAIMKCSVRSDIFGIAKQKKWLSSFGQWKVKIEGIQKGQMRKFEFFVLW